MLQEIPVKSRRALGNILETYIPNKLVNLEEMDKFLGIHDLPKLNQDTMNNLNRSIANETGSLLRNKRPGPN